MKQNIFASALLFLLALSAATPASAQSEAFDTFVEKQFYGNRIQGGSLLLNGSLQYTGYDDPNRDGFAGRAGMGLGIGLTEFLALSFSFQREELNQANPFTGQFISQGVSTTFQAGLRFLPTTVGGFIQPYVGLDYFTVSGPNDLAISGGALPVGVIFWISTFMAVSIQPLSFTVAGNAASEADYNAEFNVDLNMLNPTFGISFLLNGKKP